MNISNRNYSKKPKRHGCGPGNRRVSGFTLVEVLVSLLVLSIGLLGLASLQATGLRYSGNTGQRNQAIILAQDMMERMRSNTDGLVGNNYEVSTTLTGTVPGCSGANCSATNMATYDVMSWQSMLAATLPSGTGVIDLTGPVAGVYTATVTVTWRERQTEGATSTAATTKTFVMASQI
jgi:type IV pilus assembly protein PilV